MELGGRLESATTAMLLLTQKIGQAPGLRGKVDLRKRKFGSTKQLETIVTCGISKEARDVFELLEKLRHAAHRKKEHSGPTVFRGPLCVILDKQMPRFWLPRPALLRLARSKG